MVSIQHNWKKYGTVIPAVAYALISVLPQSAWASDQLKNICGKTTQQLFQACQYDAKTETRTKFAICLNISDRMEAKNCIRATHQAHREINAQCKDIREARNDVCEETGPGAYDPVIDPANFVSGIDNRYTPFPPGAFRVYEKKTAEGVERIRVEVLPETREIMGVTVMTLRDTVTLNGVLIEDTKDWLAQDKHGNVWYFGEIVQNFEDGRLANLDGSFEAGKDGAKPGFWVKAAPRVGETYRQEWALGEAEDVVEVISLDAKDTRVPFSQNATGPILKTRDTTPLSPGVDEFKYYVPGIGFALEVKPATGERLELVDYGPR